MKARRFSVLAFALLALPLALLAATLEHPSVSIIAVGLNPCNQHPDHRCRVELAPEPAVLMPAGGSGWFKGVMNTQYGGWTVANGGALTGKLRIETYDAFNDCDPGGATMRIFYEPGAGDPASIVWSQGIFTNHRLGGTAGTYVSYMDVLVDSNPSTHEPPEYPYQYADQHFYDKPSRPCPGGGYVRWDGEAYVTQADHTTKTLTVYEGVEWGFRYWCWPLTPLRADDGTGKGTTSGATDGHVDYNPVTQTMTITAPVTNIMNTTGGDEFDLQFATDPLQNAQTIISDLHYAGPDTSGGQLFTDGQLVVQSADGIAFMAEITGLCVDDTMMMQSGFNIVGTYGEIHVFNEMNSPLMERYLNNLLDNEVPQFVMTTYGPFTDAFADGELPVSVDGLFKNGFAFPQPPLFHPGDMNCDGIVDLFDIDPFVELLTNPAVYAINHPDCPGEQVGDTNGDGLFNLFDIDGFVAILTGG